jgi:hypothetical protein
MQHANLIFCWHSISGSDGDQGLGGAWAMYGVATGRHICDYNLED